MRSIFAAFLVLGTLFLTSCGGVDCSNAANVNDPACRNTQAYNPAYPYSPTQPGQYQPGQYQPGQYQPGQYQPGQYYGGGQPPYGMYPCSPGMPNCYPVYR